ncbi:unnamed protein product [Caenorhabditis angaria]|uniref:DUF19 domain-containing protein n=1 Tax=Caenorhabditis angaria TaxID=860376 RepID=A0A9P1IWY9_9PELO|nr:unnamed protein product [Caenorhabditis angaria]
MYSLIFGFLFILAVASRPTEKETNAICHPAMKDLSYFHNSIIDGATNKTAWYIETIKLCDSLTECFKRGFNFSIRDWHYAVAESNCITFKFRKSEDFEPCYNVFEQHKTVKSLFPYVNRSINDCNLLELQAGAEESSVYTLCGNNYIQPYRKFYKKYRRAFGC